MDHATAYVVPFSSGTAAIETIESAHLEGMADTAGHGEKHMNHKEQAHDSAFYKHLGEIIKGYDDVLLFGPTDAKLELHNLLLRDSHFEQVKIETQTTDKMTPNQLHAFVTKHFEPASL